MRRISAVDRALNNDPPPPHTNGTPAKVPPSSPATNGHAKPNGTLAYYDSARGQFWTLNTRGEWIQFSESSLRRLLKYQIFHGTPEREAQMQLIDRRLLSLQQEEDVAYAGAVAGYRVGLQEICGQRVLITSGPRLLTPREGEWATLRVFVQELLGDQVRIFYGWIKSALRTLYAGPPWRPGQMLAIAGPPGCGKSLLQNLITEMLGGRSGKPYRYMIGDTTFNGELLQCEHLMIEDEAASTDVRIRRHFGSQLKNMIVNEVQSMHRKGRDAMSVTPFWRVTISLNDEPENLMVLPPVDDSLRDKLTLLRGRPFVPPYAADDIEGRNRWRNKLSAELPAFMCWLRTWRPSPAMVNVRYGVKAYQDEELLRELHETSPEFQLLELIDALQIWGIDGEPFEGTASEIKTRLLEKDKHGRAQRLLSFSSTCGTYLARLCHKRPDRVTTRKSGPTSRKYTLQRPTT